MALGGFTGGDPILTEEELSGLVADGTVRFFLVRPRRGRQDDLTHWVTEHCVAVPQEVWGSAGSGPGGSPQLFDCASAG